jgi:hypothetical protein
VRTLILIVISGLFVSTISAQGISPLIQQIPANRNNRATGQFTVTNTGIQPLATVLEAKSFSVDETGQMETHDLDRSIHLRLSEMSAKIPPSAVHVFNFEVVCDHAPCWFQIYSSNGEARAVKRGVGVRIMLGETIYVYQSLLVRGDVVTAWRDPQTLVLENHGDSFGHAKDVQVRYDGKTVGGHTFPLFPHSRRIIHFDRAPQKVSIVFEKFKLDATP